MIGDESVVTKAGEKTYGLDWFYSGLLQKVVPSLAFFALALVNVKERRSYPMRVEQTIRSAEEKAASKAKAEARKAKKKSTEEKRKVGRPKGSKNKSKAEVSLNPELLRIQSMIQALQQTIKGVISVTFVVLDGHFGNHPTLQMIRQCQLHLISKLRHDAALYYPYAGEYQGRGPHNKYGARVEYRKMPDEYLKSSKVEDGILTRIYQTKLLHREFSQPLNVVVIVKTNLATQTMAHVILFSSELTLSAEKMVDFYSLRFQIEFNFRDAKQYWGLEDFMNISQRAVTNAANLALFMVNLSYALLVHFRQEDADFSILDLKAHYRGYRYAMEILKMSPQKTDRDFISQLFQNIVLLGRVHAPKTHASTV
jgi:hypothetical protein